MCTIIDIETRERSDSERPTLPEFLAARFGSGFRISDDWDPEWAGETVTLRGARVAVAQYEAKFGATA
ncbi:MAG: hypothetical protein MEQ84_11775 [Mesorhizobium sp.]|nr:hypothetical protein [Mesorhizobium sp.]